MHRNIDIQKKKKREKKIIESRRAVARPPAKTLLCGKLLETFSVWEYYDHTHRTDATPCSTEASHFPTHSF